LTNDLTRILLSLVVLLSAGWIVYATCAPTQKRSASTGSEVGRVLPGSPSATPLGRFLAGLGWGLFAALVVLAAVHLTIALRR
jgi:hypothetical protein